MIIKANRPSVKIVGEIRSLGFRQAAVGWVLGPCLSNCSCHQHPVTGGLLLSSEASNLLGLQRYRPCSCCGQWTYIELGAMARDLAEIEAMETSDAAGAS